MKKILYPITMTLLLCIILASCKDEKEEEVIVKPSITLSGGSSHTVECQGGTIEVNFSSTKSWTASSGQSWCRVSPTSGQGGNAQLTITVDENTTTDERNASVTIKSESASTNITINQKQKDALTVTSQKVEINALGGEAIVQVKANVTYTCEIESQAKDWISIGSSRAMADSEIKLIIKENEDFEKREGKITIRSGELSETVTVYQAGAVPSIILSQNEYVVGSQEETLTIQLRSNVNYRMVMPEDVEWLQVVESRAFSSYTHYLQVAANDTYGARTAVIHFINEEDNLDETVKITQMQNDAIIVALDEYTLEAVTTQLSFDVQTNVELEVSTTADWIHYGAESRALETKQLVFSLDENITIDSREGFIQITSGELKQEIKVVQQGRVDRNTVKVLHTNWNLVIPTITGNNLLGTIQWGDGQQEEYRVQATHPYTEGKEYLLQLDVWGAEEIDFPNIEGIIEIDLSKF